MFRGRIYFIYQYPRLQMCEQGATSNEHGVVESEKQIVWSYKNSMTKMEKLHLLLPLRLNFNTMI